MRTTAFSAERLAVTGGKPERLVGPLATLALALPAHAIPGDCEHVYAPLGSGTAGGLTLPAVLSMARFDPDGNGEKPELLHLGGNFTHAGGIRVNSVATWDGTNWGRLVSPGGRVGVGGGQVVTSVHAITVFDDDGDGPNASALIAAGDFTTAGDVAANHIARWDGTDWTPLGGGLGWGTFAATVRALAVFDDDGDGPAAPMLYAGGDFVRAGGMPATFIARWDGATWSDVGGGVDSTVSAFAVFDDGTGPALYVAGNFNTAGAPAIDAHFVARWDGAQWSSLGEGVNGSVRALAVYANDGTPALHAGGYFTQAGGVAADLVARWDGADWEALGSGLGSSQLFPGVEAMTVYDDGTGSDLHVTGQFETAGGSAATNVASWNGFHWSAVGGGVGAGDTMASGRALGEYLGDLYVGGNFTQAGEVFANNVARWNGCPPSCPADLFPLGAPDGFVGLRDFAVLRARWGECPPPCRADLFPLGAPDGIVNAHDLAELLAQRGRCR